MKDLEAQASSAAKRPHIFFFAAVFACAAGVGSLRELEVGKTETAAADDAAARADWTQAVEHARGAAEAFVPGSPWPEQGMRRLEAIGRDAAIRGDRDTALLAYGALRTAVLAIHIPGAPSGRWRSVADEGLARLSPSRREAPGASESTQAIRAALKDDGMAHGRVALLAASLLVVLVGFGMLLGVEGASARARRARFLIAAGFAAYAAVLLLS